MATHAHSTLIPSPDEHPFARFVRTVGKGKKGARSLTQQEAVEAMGMIMRGDVLDVQLGAFLMLLRVKEETPEEIAGFVQGVRQHMNRAPQDLSVDLDLSSYAGKRQHQPWFLLAALALADAGYRVFMHGTRGHTAGRLYSEDVLRALDLPVCEDWAQVASALDAQHFAFMPLSVLAPRLQQIIDLRNQLGLRSPVHTLSRLLNPTRAPHTLQSIFHPAYASMHQRAAQLLGEAHAAVFKGDGGEAERRPDATCTVLTVHNGVLGEDVWPRLIPERAEKDDVLDVDVLKRVWSGAASHPYGELAIVGTLAISLRLMGRADSDAEALALGRQVWATRNPQRLGG